MIKEIIKFFTCEYNLGKARPPQRFPDYSEEMRLYNEKCHKYLSGKKVITVDDLKLIFSGDHEAEVWVSKPRELYAEVFKLAEEYQKLRDAADKLAEALESIVTCAEATGCQNATQTYMVSTEALARWRKFRGKK